MRDYACLNEKRDAQKVGVTQLHVMLEEKVALRCGRSTKSCSISTETANLDAAYIMWNGGNRSEKKRNAFAKKTRALQKVIDGGRFKCRLRWL